MQEVTVFPRELVMEVLLLVVKSVFLLLCLFIVKSAANCLKPQGLTTMVLTDATLLLNSFPENVTITVECANGYVKENGTGRMICKYGQWSEPDLNCKRKDCGRPKDQPNVIFNLTGGTLFGDLISVTCSEGYVISGSSFKRCYAHGWSGYATCEKLETQSTPPPTQDTSSTTESTETTHREKTSVTSSVPPLATTSPSQRDTSFTTESSTHRDKTSSVPPLATTSPSQQEFDKNTRILDTNKDIGHIPVIISVISVSLVVCIGLLFTYRFFQRRAGSSNGTMPICEEQL